MFVRRAGTIILACMIVVWALLYFPVTDAQGGSYDARLDAAEAKVRQAREELTDLEEKTAGKEDELADLPADDAAGRQKLHEEIAAAEEEMKPLRAQVEPVDRLRREWAEQSLLGRAGKAIEPAVRPLGWDWRIGVSALASFPAREVVVGTLGMIFNQGKGESDDSGYRRRLGTALQREKWDDGSGRPLFTVPVALSVMVFFALCCQCASTLAVIRRETNSWRWPAFTFVYMTALAYVGALLVYQVGSWLA
jgi:ferrous iron transport protein B